MTMMKKKLLTAVACVALLAMPSAALADSSDVHLLVGNDYVDADASTGAPYINDAGRTMIPLRVVGEAMGYTTEWQADGSIHVVGDDGAVDVTMQVGSNAYIANGEAGTFETAPTLKDDRTYLPARDFSELYGSVYWENDTRTVWIYQDEKTIYTIMGNSLLRADANGIVPLTMPEGCEVSQFGKGDFIINQRVIDGTGYVTINYNHNHSMQGPLLRDDGDHMTRLITLNVGSSFWVDGDTIYYTHGTNAGPWSNYIDPYRLVVTTLKDGEEITKGYDMDFAINSCTLDMIDGQLVATNESGVQHMIDVEVLN